MENRNYAGSFALSEDDKRIYREFAQKVHAMSPEELFNLNSTAGELCSEQQDIIAWELKIRELDIYKKKNIDPSKEFSIENARPNIPYINDTPQAQSFRAAERKAMIGMDEKLLERSKQILEDNPVVISSSNLHNYNGGGVNMLSKKYIVEDSNGKRITIDNQKIQEHYRKMYVKAMSDATGIDYTQYDLSGNDDVPNLDYYDPDNVSRHDPNEKQSYNTSIADLDASKHINYDEYEDDD